MIATGMSRFHRALPTAGADVTLRAIRIAPSQYVAYQIAPQRAVALPRTRRARLPPEDGTSRTLTYRARQDGASSHPSVDGGVASPADPSIILMQLLLQRKN